MLKLIVPVVVAGMMLAGCASSPSAPSGSAAGVRPTGGAFNLRVLSDSVPDFSSRKNFVHSALSGWPTEQEKATAQFRWMHRCRRVGPFAPEDSRPVLDPVLFFNSYGVFYCSMISQANVSLWEARGLKGRCVDLPGHVVSEVYYDDAWHLFDNDFCQYYLKSDGTVASAADLAGSRIHGNVKDLKPGEYYVFDHCAASSSPRGRVLMGPSSWSILDVARDWYPDPQRVRPRLAFGTAHAGHRYVLGIRPGESYTRYWQPLGTGPLYCRPFGDGKDPAADGTVLRNSRSNGRWSWSPDLSDPGVYFQTRNVTVGPHGVCATLPSQPAWVVFRVAAANAVTSAALALQGFGRLQVSASGNHGLSWMAVRTEPSVRAGRVGAIAQPIAGRLDYLLRVDLCGGDRLTGLQLETVTQVNPRTLPALRLGANHIAAVSDGHYQSEVFNPRLAGGLAAAEVVSMEGFQSLVNPHDGEPSLRSTGPARLMLAARAPRPIASLRMAATVLIPESGAEFFMKVSFDGGKSWRQVKHEIFGGWPADHRYDVTVGDVPAGCREALMAYSFDSGGAGLVEVVAETRYPPDGPFMPYDVTYCWSEYRDGAWVQRQHRQRVAGDDLRYVIDVGGTRPPRMHWVRVGPAGDRPTGYSDGQDVGGAAARADYRLSWGNRLQEGKPCTLSRPASAAFPDNGGRLLTDGYVGIASFWNLQDIRLAGKKNEKRVGELAVWSPGEPVVATIDLGEARTAGGARVCAVGPNHDILFPQTMEVEVSADGKTFTPAGSAGWEDCFFPPIDEMRWEGEDSPVYDDLPAGGIIDNRFPILFDRPRAARYVRFTLTPQPGKGIGLWELEVYDRVTRTEGGERIQLPTPEGK